MNFDKKICFDKKNCSAGQRAIGKTSFSFVFCFLLNLTLFITLTNKLTDQYVKAQKNAVSQKETHKKDTEYKPCNMPE